MLPKIDKVISIMQQSIEDWHVNSAPVPNPYREGSFEYLIFKKNQIDTIQWHVEDEIRRPDLPATELVTLKRRIDSLNQERTDTVEVLDDIIFHMFKDVPKKEGSRLNSETPAWLLDRMSILELKIYHMKEQTERKDASEEHLSKCSDKLRILLEQREDMKLCFTQLVEDLVSGAKYTKLYKQMKMYNDRELNPALYQSKK